MIFYKTDEQNRVLMHTNSFKTAQDYGLNLSCEDDGLEKAWDGSLWVKGYAPEEPEEHKKEVRKRELKAQLNALDLNCIRSLRAIQSGKGTDADTVILSDFEKEAEEIRKQLRLLGD